MPITPFHFGPGAALHAVAPRHVSFLSFCAANVLIDVESLYNLVHQRVPVHAFFHTYVGATLIAVATVGLFAVLRFTARRVPVPDLLRWQELTYVQIISGAALGVYSHVALDSLMHRDITPLAPFSNANILLGAVSLSALHGACLGAGLLGLVIIGIRNARSANDSPTPDRSRAASLRKPE